MTQLSRIALSPLLQKQIVFLFRHTIAQVQKENDVADFLDELLTPTEKTMLAKRLAIAWLLDKGYDQRTIHTLLRVSTATVNAVNMQYAHKGRGYKKIFALMHTSHEWEIFINSLDEGIEELVSPKAWHRRIYGSTYKKEQ
jgi:uncharacterized protein YerC